ncbi:MAG TPA: nuclear transport factor 2 family protein [Arenibaculum sp.]|nr:nuclear transport factor 2 family protein [Arenibaculum sp.]
MPLSGSAEDTLSIVQQAFQCVAARDTDGLLALVADDVAWLPPDRVGHLSWGGRFSGRAEVARWIDAVKEALEELVLVPHDFLVADDTVVVLGRETARVRATGAGYDTDFAHVIRVRDGRIISFRGFHDTAAVLAAAGAGKRG